MKPFRFILLSFLLLTFASAMCLAQSPHKVKRIDGSKIPAEQLTNEISQNCRQRQNCRLVRRRY